MPEEASEVTTLRARVAALISEIGRKDAQIHREYHYTQELHERIAKLETQDAVEPRRTLPKMTEPPTPHERALKVIDDFRASIKHTHWINDPINVTVGDLFDLKNAIYQAIADDRKAMAEAGHNGL